MVKYGICSGQISFYFYTDVIISLFCPDFITVGNSGHTSQGA